MNIVYVFFIVNKIRGERDVIEMIIRNYEYCLCVLLLIKWERERGEGGIF